MKKLTWEEIRGLTPMLFLHDETFFLYEKPADVLLAEKFLPSGKIKIGEQDWGKQLQELILPAARPIPEAMKGCCAWKVWACTSGGTTGAGAAGTFNCGA